MSERVEDRTIMLADEDQDEDRREMREMQTGMAQQYEAAKQRVLAGELYAVNPEAIRDTIQRCKARAEELAAKWPGDETFTNALKHAEGLHALNEFYSP